MTEPNPPVLVEFASTEELWAELKRRHSAALLVVEIEPDGDHTKSTVCYSGGTNRAMGLAHRARIVLGIEMAADHVDPEDKE